MHSTVFLLALLAIVSFTAVAAEPRRVDYSAGRYYRPSPSFKPIAQKAQKFRVQPKIRTDLTEEEKNWFGPLGCKSRGAEQQRDDATYKWFLPSATKPAPTTVLTTEVPAYTTPEPATRTAGNEGAKVVVTTSSYPNWYMFLPTELGGFYVPGRYSPIPKATTITLSTIIETVAPRRSKRSEGVEQSMVAQVTTMKSESESGSDSDDGSSYFHYDLNFGGQWRKVMNEMVREGGRSVQRGSTQTLTRRAAEARKTTPMPTPTLKLAIKMEPFDLGDFGQYENWQKTKGLGYHWRRGLSKEGNAKPTQPSSPMKSSTAVEQPATTPKVEAKLASKFGNELADSGRYFNRDRGEGWRKGLRGKARQGGGGVERATTQTLAKRATTVAQTEATPAGMPKLATKFEAEPMETVQYFDGDRGEGWRKGLREKARQGGGGEATQTLVKRDTALKQSAAAPVPVPKLLFDLETIEASGDYFYNPHNIGGEWRKGLREKARQDGGVVQREETQTLVKRVTVMGQSEAAPVDNPHTTPAAAPKLRSSLESELENFPNPFYNSRNFGGRWRKELREKAHQGGGGVSHPEMPPNLQKRANPGGRSRFRDLAEITGYILLGTILAAVVVALLFTCGQPLWWPCYSWVRGWKQTTPSVDTRSLHNIRNPAEPSLRNRGKAMAEMLEMQHDEVDPYFQRPVASSTSRNGYLGGSIWRAHIGPRRQRMHRLEALFVRRDGEDGVIAEPEVDARYLRGTL